MNRDEIRAALKGEEPFIGHGEKVRQALLLTPCTDCGTPVGVVGINLCPACCNEELQVQRLLDGLLQGLMPGLPQIQALQRRLTKLQGRVDEMARGA